MTLIYLSHWRFPSEKTMSPLIMKTCEMFAREGIAVELWIPWRNNRGFSHQDPFLYHGIERRFTIRRLPALDLTGVIPGSPVFFIMIATFLASAFWYAMVRRFPADTIFYFHDARDAFLLSLLRRPMVLEVHDFYKSSIGWFNRFIFSRIRGFIVTNRLKIEALRKDFGVTQEKMLHRPNGVDIALFSVDVSRKEARQKLHLPIDAYIVLYTGHLFYWKGADTLLETATQVQEENFQFSTSHFQNNLIFYFVGGTDEDVEKFKVESLKLKATNVVIVGRRPHGEIPFWLRAADALVLPSPAKYPESKYETSPVKLFEYMASGSPIIASDVPSIRDVVDERTVFFAEPDDPRSFAEVIHFVLAHPDGAAARAHAAQKLVTRYSWEERTRAIIGFLGGTLPNQEDLR